MHSAIALITAIVGAEVTPAPTDLPNPDLVTPGPWGFVAIGVVALAVIFLVWDMMRRIRRGRYRDEVREELDAEEAAAAQAKEAVTESDVDDEDIRKDDEPR